MKYLLFYIALLSFAQTDTLLQLNTESIDYEKISAEQYTSKIEAYQAKNLVNKKIDHFDIYWFDEQTNYSPSSIFYPISKDLIYHLNLEYNIISIDTTDLDSFGKPELIVRTKACEYGSGGGTCKEYFSIINIDSIPYFVMREQVSESIEGFSRTYGIDTEPTPYVYESCERQVHIKNKQIIIKETIEKDNEAPRDFDCELTNIPNGTYYMKNGKIYLIKNN